MNLPKKPIVLCKAVPQKGKYKENRWDAINGILHIKLNR